MFRLHVGTAFTIQVEGAEPLVLTLDAVRVGARGHEHRAEPFTLAFSGPVDRMAPQATLTLDHPELGRSCCSLVPVDRGRYEAVVN